MKKLLIAFLLFGCSVQAEELEIKRVLSVYDGDTFKVDLDCDIDLFCKNISVRVAGIDTPEMKGECLDEKFKAVVAKEYISQFLKQDNVVLEDCQRDKYFRILCRVVSDDKDLSEELIKNGNAVEYNGGTKKGWCHD